MGFLPCLLGLVVLTALVESGEKCPPLFGEFECPKDFKCVFGVCKNEKDEPAPNDCSKITCDLDAKCVDGKCLSVQNLPCGRNVLVAENTARAIISDCGWRGKCINGRCAVDKCFEKLCNEDETCRDGVCTKLIGAFCWSNFDCGPSYRCVANHCAPTSETATSLPAPNPRCDPGEVFKDHKCQKQEGCDKLVCDVGESCLDGVCVPLAIDCRSEACPTGMVCGNTGLCVIDPCIQRGCPVDHACMLGECRPLQGMLCREHCPLPYVCSNGVCVRDECRRKVCQIGQRCEGGLCVGVNDAFCSLAIRDCGEAFVCQESAPGSPKTCKDTIKAINGTEIAEFS